jgi:hypothetical protein
LMQYGLMRAMAVLLQRTVEVQKLAFEVNICGGFVYPEGVYFRNMHR